MEHNQLVCEDARVLANEGVGPRLFVVSLESPRIAARLQPGQFVHLQVPGMPDHILRRPFSVFDCDPQAGTLDILYQDLGYGSHRMTGLATGDVVSQIGPVGHGWQAPADTERALLIGGGVGAAPLFLHAKALLAAGVAVDVVLGAATKAALATYDAYTALLGHAPVVATDDGSFGFSGFCTQPAADLLAAHAYDHVACCGPEPLMRIVAQMASDAQVECQVSMERRMACGVGACLSCVVDTTDGKRRACVDGPVFESSKVVW